MIVCVVHMSIYVCMNVYKHMHINQAGMLRGSNIHVTEDLSRCLCIYECIFDIIYVCVCVHVCV